MGIFCIKIFYDLASSRPGFTVSRALSSEGLANVPGCFFLLSHYMSSLQHRYMAACRNAVVQELDGYRTVVQHGQLQNFFTQALID